MYDPLMVKINSAAEAAQSTRAGVRVDPKKMALRDPCHRKVRQAMLVAYKQ